MPQPSARASALALTIAAKQRTSKVFDDAAPLQRPSACASDRQTQLFARNLRAQAPRSPSLSHASRSSSSLASQPESRAQLNYMRATSSSRRRSKNSQMEEVEQIQSCHPQLRSLGSSSSRRLRSQSPSRGALYRAPSSSTSSLRRATPRQGPPLPLGGPYPKTRTAHVEQRTAMRRTSDHHQQEDALADGVTRSWHVNRSHLPSLAQHPLVQKPESLSSSWTVRDPLTSANNASAHVAEDDTLQLDASDQQELAKITATFQRSRLHNLEGRTESRVDYGAGSVDHGAGSVDHGAGSVDHTAVAPCSVIGDIQGGSRTHVLQPQVPKSNEKAPVYGSIINELFQRRMTDQQGTLIQSSQDAEKKQHLSYVPPISLRQRQLLGGSGNLEIINTTDNDTRSGVACSAFGEPTTPAYCTRAALLWRVLDALSCFARFVFVLVVCTCRLLNTSYDSWSARHFTESFRSVLSGKGFLRHSKAADRRLESNVISSTVSQQTLPPRLSAASISRISQKQQLLSQQNSHHDHGLVPGEVNGRPMSEFSYMAKARTAKTSAGCPYVCAELVDSGVFWLKASVVGVALCCVYWLMIPAPREEYADFDFM